MRATEAQNWGGAVGRLPKIVKTGQISIVLLYMVAYIHKIAKKKYLIYIKPGHLFKFYHCSLDLCNMALNSMKEYVRLIVKEQTTRRANPLWNAEKRRSLVQLGLLPVRLGKIPLLRER